MSKRKRLSDTLSLAKRKSKLSIKETEKALAKLMDEAKRRTNNNARIVLPK